jgi:hypothetical protein
MNTQVKITSKDAKTRTVLRLDLSTDDADKAAEIGRLVAVILDKPSEDKPK